MAAYNWRSYENAKKFVHSLNLKSKSEWYKFSKSKNKPKNIPANPPGVYKNKGWISWGDFLSTGYVATYDREYRAFKDARKFAHSLKVRTSQEWFEYAKSGKKPDDIPNDIGHLYKDKGWKGWDDFLNTKEKPKKERYRQFEEARKFARSLKLDFYKDWTDYCKSGKRPYDIPVHPERHYKDWKGMGDWLGTGRIASQNMQYRPVKEAREFVRKLKLPDIEGWKKYAKSGKKPDDIPANLYQTYKEKFKAGDWLGTGRIANQDRKYRSFEDAREFVRKLKHKNIEQWNEYRKSGKKPDDIPGTPLRAYKKEWKGYGDWLGTGRIANKDRKFLPFPEAMKEYKKLAKEYGLNGIADWKRFVKTHKLPKDLPAAPWHIYAKEKVWGKMKK